MAGIRALLGLFPNTGDYESSRNILEEEYNDLLAFKNSKQLRDFLALEAQVNSDEFAAKKKEIISLRFKNTDDYTKESEYHSLRKAKDIKLYYQTKDSEELNHYFAIEKSAVLKEYNELKTFVASDEFAEAKRYASVSAKQKFNRSDLAKTLEQYNTQKNDDRIKGYFKFVKDKRYDDYIKAQEEGLAKNIEKLEKTVASDSFKEKLAAYKKSERKASEEYQLLMELKQQRKLKEYKNFLKVSSSPLLPFYTELHDSDELHVFTELDKFIRSDEFQQQRKEIESKSFKDTVEYTKLLKFNELKKSADIVFYHKYHKSKQLANYQQLHKSERIAGYEELQDTINSEEFLKFKAYCLKAPKKRWEESEEYEVLQDYELQKKSEKIIWFYKYIEHKKFSWHRSWTKTFSDEFTVAKVDTKKWLTRYYWADKMLKESYSVSNDKHFVTDGKNLNVDNGRLHIITKKEEVKGKSWHAKHGFLTRNFSYTSGLVNTANSFRQKYGIFEAKIRINEERELINAFWLVGETMVPHVDIVKANRKLWTGNYWGNVRLQEPVKKYTSKRGRTKFAADFFIYTLEWGSDKLIWKINGVEIASTSNGIPNEELYMVFSAGLQHNISGSLPAQMEVDWVRCYQSNDMLKKKD